jgi:hypothetical protein
MDNPENEKLDLTVDMDNLYREENFTDLKVASIRRLIPVQPDGSEDKSRTPIFLGTTQLMTPEGLLPIQARLVANNLKEAIEAFPAAMQTAVEEMIAEAQKIRQKEESRIIVPD